MSASRSTKRPSNPSDGPSKKVRFDTRDPSKLAAEESDEDEEDIAVLELDSIGKAAGSTKRSAVNLDGFDSDSDNDNFNQRAADKAKAQKQAAKKGKSGEDDDDDDMFAEEEDDKADEDDEDTAVKKKKAVRFVNNEDIAGQDWNSEARTDINFDLKDQSGRVQDLEDDTDSESGGDEGRDQVDEDEDAQELGAGAKKKHAPRLDAFNMKTEGEEGKFDESGNFVRRTDPNAIHDSWLEGVSKKEMKKARDAEQKREEERRRRTREQDAVLTADLLGMLITHLETGESALEALQRLGKSKPKPKPKWQKNKKETHSMDLDDEQSQQAELKRRATVEAITEAADQLLSRGKDDVYETERELLMRMYKRETGDDWVDAAKAGHNLDEDDSLRWQFRWSDARDGGAFHGPYDAQTLRSWSDAGYFANGDVEFRRGGQSNWTKVMEFV